MAEFLNKHKRTPKIVVDGDSGFNAFGKPVSTEKRSAALKHIRDIGITDTGVAWECIGKMANAIERDQPYEAQRAGMEVVDLIGTYRLMAVLCAG